MANCVTLEPACLQLIVSVLVAWTVCASAVMFVWQLLCYVDGTD